MNTIIETGVTLHPVDLGIVIVYALFMVAIELYFGRQHNDAQDYFLAGRKMVWPLIGISLFAFNISSTTLLGLAGAAYSTGISVFNYESMAAVALIFGVFFFFPFLLRLGVYTMPEFLERRYSTKARTYFSLRHTRPNLTSHQLMRVGQAATFGFMLLAVLWAPQIENFGSLFKYLQRFLSYAVPPVVTMFLAGMFWRRANASGAIAAWSGTRITVSCRQYLPASFLS